MINSIKFVLAFGVLLLSFGVQARSGGIGDGGGQGFVCRDENGDVQSAQLLDLAEAEGYYLLSLKQEKSDVPYLEIAQEYSAKLDAAIPATSPTSQWSNSGNGPESKGYEVNVGLVGAYHSKYPFIGISVNRIDSTKMLIPGNRRIPPVYDSHPRVLPTGKGCNIEQIAIYTDGNNQVHFVGSVWEKLSNVDKAALLIHEALYRNLREMGDSDSDRTRKAVAYLFGGFKFNWVLDGLPEKFLTCWTDGDAASFRFVVYPYDDHRVTAQFLIYNGEVMLSDTRAILHGAPFAKMFGLNAPLKNDQGVVDKLENPLLDVPTYDYSIRIDPKSGAISASIEAVALVGGRNERQIVCNSHLTTVTYGSDGTSVGPAH